jgi:hypothetical protein
VPEYLSGKILAGYGILLVMFTASPLFEVTGGKRVAPGVVRLAFRLTPCRASPKDGGNPTEAGELCNTRYSHRFLASLEMTAL